MLVPEDRNSEKNSWGPDGLRKGVLRYCLFSSCGMFVCFLSLLKLAFILEQVIRVFLFLLCFQLWPG